MTAWARRLAAAAVTALALVAVLVPGPAAMADGGRVVVDPPGLPAVDRLAWCVSRAEP